jgi:hypothetical protein
MQSMIQIFRTPSMTLIYMIIYLRRIASFHFKLVPPRLENINWVGLKWYGFVFQDLWKNDQILFYQFHLYFI